MSTRPTLQQERTTSSKDGAQRAEKESESVKLARAIASVRERVGMTKKDFHIRVAPGSDKIEIYDETFQFERTWLQSEAQIVEWLRSGDPIWRGRDPQKLVKQFRGEMRANEEPKPQAKANPEDESPYVKPKSEGAFFQAANAVFDWRLPLRPAEITAYLCLVRHANGRKGRVAKISGDQIGEECGMVGRHARRVVAFLERVTLIEKTFKGGARGGERASHRKTNEYLIPWLTRTFTRDSLVSAIEKARKGWKYNEGGVRGDRTRVSDTSRADRTRVSRESDTGVRKIGHGCTNGKNRRTKSESTEVDDW
jgi:hypothetical protein